MSRNEQRYLFREDYDRPRSLLPVDKVVLCTLIKYTNDERNNNNNKTTKIWMDCKSSVRLVGSQQRLSLVSYQPQNRIPTNNSTQINNSRKESYIV
mmetsp:Transcript_51874/g.56170  ORF Transcript_51874/g.56170 Transcript_51874/m.56170 type:complete len:96 (-) Transcript_51874:11-298(-)